MEVRKTRGSLLLFLAALIWGAAFVVQKIGALHLGAFTLNAARFFISGAALLPLVVFGGAIKKGDLRNGEDGNAAKKAALFGGVSCGFVLALAAAAQQAGIESTTAGKAGFITALYIVFVPAARIFLGRKVALPVIISVPAAVAGLYLLCVNEGFSINAGDALVLLCAFLFTIQILLIGRFALRADVILMSCVQFFTVAAISAALMFIFEKPRMSDVLYCWAPLMYLGVVSGAAGYTLQIFGQRDTDPAVASLIFSLESVFAAVAGGVFLGEGLSAKELAGCALVFGATMASQINFRKRTSKSVNNRSV